MARRQKREPLMVRVWAELGAGQIREDYIIDPKEFVYGLCEGRRITINPVLSLVETTIHELLHRLYPAWSERYVRNRTTYLMRRMTDQEIQTFYDEYRRRVRHEE